MTHTIILRELSDVTANEWDNAVAVYPDTTVFHLSGWHTCLERSLPGSVLRFEVEADGELCGHWCGFLATKFGMRVFGAPLPGSATDYMYPLFSKQPPVGQFLAAVHSWAKDRRIGMVELGGEYFSEADLAANRYKIRRAVTYRVDLSVGAADVWKNLKPAMRNKIHKAEKSGVVISRDTSPEFSGRFFDMLQAVFNRQGLTPTYGLSRVETLVRTLAESDNVVTLTAWREGQALASIILLADSKAFYFWGGASYDTAYPFGANDAVHWHALQLAIEKGLAVYDTCGGGAYKTKFGGTLVSIPGGYLCIDPLFRVVRGTVRIGVRTRSVVLGHAKRLGRNLA
jgi:hypothetical protein